MCTLPSPLPANRRTLSLSKETHSTPLAATMSKVRAFSLGCLDCRSHSLTKPSLLPVATQCPSGEKAALLMVSACPRRGMAAAGKPSAAIVNSCALLSALPETTSLPSPLNSSAQISRSWGWPRRWGSVSEPLRSQLISCPVMSAESKKRSSGESARRMTSSLCPSSGVAAQPDSASHMRMALSVAHENSLEPSELNTRSMMSPSWPSSFLTVSLGLGLTRSQTKMVWSAPAVAAKRPPGAKATALIGLVWPRSTWRG